METEELSFANVGELHKVVEGIAQVVNQRLIHLISEQYQLMTHLRVSLRPISPLSGYLRLPCHSFIHTCIHGQHTYRRSRSLWP